MKRPDSSGQKGQTSIEALASLLGSSDHSMYYRGATVSLGVINILPQPRKTFEGIAELALDIAVKGQLAPPIVARFDRVRFGRYLKVVNGLWNTSFHVSAFHGVRERKKLVYYILLAGERRYRSLIYLWREGCEECREKYGKEKAGRCFGRHFKRRNDTVEVRLCMNVPPLAALFLQLSENTHMAVPPHEEAEAYTLLYRLVREADKKFSLAQFARRVGRSPETVRNALRFSDLPVSIRESVEKKRISYGIALEFTRLRREGLKKDELDWWMTRAIVERKKVTELHDVVTKYLAERNSDQMDLLGVMQREEEKLARRLHIRKTVAVNVIYALWSLIHYFRRVMKLFGEGKLGYEDSPFSTRSPIRVFLSLIEAMEELHPHFRGLISHARHTRAKEILTKTRVFAERAEETAREDEIQQVVH